MSTWVECMCTEAVGDHSCTARQRETSSPGLPQSKRSSDRATATSRRSSAVVSPDTTSSLLYDSKEQVVTVRYCCALMGWLSSPRLCGMAVLSLWMPEKGNVVHCLL